MPRRRCRHGGGCACAPVTASRSISSMPGSRSSKSNATIVGIPIDAQRELRQIVGADREAVEHFGERIDLDDVVGNFAHHEDFQPVPAPLPGRARAIVSITRFASSTRRQNGTMTAGWSSPMSRERAARPRIQERTPQHRPDARNARRHGSRASDWLRPARTRHRRAGSRIRWS